MEKIDAFEQENVLSANLQRIHRWDRIFYPLLTFFIGFTFSTLYVSYRNSTNMLGVAILYSVVVLLPIAGYFVYRYLDGTYPKTIYYSNAGLRWVARNNKEVFIPWDDIIKVLPAENYGRILGYGNGEVSDYGLFFKRPFPGYTIVSAEVAEKIREYMAEYKS